MNNIIALNNNEVSELIHSLLAAYHDGQVEGLVVGIKMKNEEFACGWTNTLHHLEKLGLCQAIINDINYAANTPD